LPLLDTGILYRAVGQQLRDAGHDLDDAGAAAAIARIFEPSWLEDPRLRDRIAGEAASRVAKVPQVREALKRFQVDFAHQVGGAVLDGRDIGTVIAPNATVKLWVDADVKERARRRTLELISRGEQVSEADILADLQARDARDAPNMVVAEDAIRLDTTTLDAQAAVAAALNIVRARVPLRAGA
ncbi:MAG: (d)CMP kinase, partial [Proteobacteria bacterium]|nr:(d)CMP kinase [Pseudomonadota bacterium]